MKTVLILQPWATLAARGEAKFFARRAPDAYRGTVAIVSDAHVDGAAVERWQSDPEFAERLATFGLHTLADIDGLPRSAIVGVAVIVDMWSLASLEEVATEDDAILLGDVDADASFVELAEALALDPIPFEPNDEPSEETEHEEDEGALSDADEATDDVADQEANDELGGDTGDDEANDEIPQEDAAPKDLVPLPDEVAAAVRAATLAKGARFDSDDLVFWPVTPSASLAVLIGDDAVGDREITNRVWAHVAENDLQDPEDHSYVYLDDALREALETNVDGLTSVAFSELLAAHVIKPTAP